MPPVLLSFDLILKLVLGSCQAYLDCTLKIPNLANVISHFCLSVFAYLITRYKMSGVFFISEQSILITD